MAGKRKPAKMGHNKSKGIDHDTAASKLIMITGKHRISKSVSPFTACGQRRAIGWHYGIQEDVRCPDCI
jgi:hypothetical protein